MQHYETHPEQTIFKVVTKYNEQLASSHKPRIFAHMEEDNRLVLLRGKKYKVTLDLNDMKPLTPDEVARKVRQTCRRLARW